MRKRANLNSNGFGVIEFLAAVLVIIVVAAGIYVYINKTDRSATNSSSGNQKTPTDSPAKTANRDIKWNKYSFEGMDIPFPQGAKIVENDSPGCEAPMCSALTIKYGDMALDMQITDGIGGRPVPALRKYKLISSGLLDGESIIGRYEKPKDDDSVCQVPHS